MVALAIVALIIGLGVWAYLDDEKKYKQRKERDKKWQEEQPKYFVSVSLKAGGVLNSPVFSSRVYFHGLQSYRIRDTAEDLANRWIENAFKKGFVQIGDEAYPIELVKKMIVVKVDE